MQRQDFHFELPAELIAQRPARCARRQPDARRSTERAGHGAIFGSAIFRGFCEPGDLLVFNDTRSCPRGFEARRIAAERSKFLLERVLRRAHCAGSRPIEQGPEGRGDRLLPGGCTARCSIARAICSAWNSRAEVLHFFETFGEAAAAPLHRRAPDEADRERYQTVYAREPGAASPHPRRACTSIPACSPRAQARGVAPRLRDAARRRGDFQPVREDRCRAPRDARGISRGERGRLCRDRGRARGGRPGGRRGTTVVRSLETAALGRRRGAPPDPTQGPTRIFIKPGFRFRVVDAMLTNFHLPESTLVMLCAAFVGRERSAGRLRPCGRGEIPIFQLR